jgi:ubiquitin-protein ligase
MVTPREARELRLKNDYKQMCNIRSGSITWRAIHGKPPHVDIYEVELQVRTIVSPKPDYRSKHLIRVELSAEYPKKPPVVTMLTQPYPFHPNWFRSGRWCPGPWVISEGLGEHIIRMIRTLQFDPIITNPASSANSDATLWYKNSQNRGWFPCDNQAFPDPTTSKISDASSTRRTFRIENQ